MWVNEDIYCLKADRQRRMLGDMEEDTSKKQSYLSADDLNDGFILDKEDRQMLSYQVSELTWNIPISPVQSQGSQPVFMFVCFFCLRMESGT